MLRSIWLDGMLVVLREVGGDADEPRDRPVDHVLGVRSEMGHGEECELRLVIQ